MPPPQSQLPSMTTDQLTLCLNHLTSAETVLLAMEDWANAAHLSLVIDRVRSSYGLTPRAPDLAEFARWQHPTDG